MTEEDNMKNSEEFINACSELNINCQLLSKTDSLTIISELKQRFNLKKISGHLALQDDSFKLPLEPNEFSFSTLLKKESAYIFFDQENINKEEVLKFENAQNLCSILENCFGMEYFLTNESLTYLIAVNWYVLEATGDVTAWLKRLE
ncbi:MAG: hypothetical protein ACJA1C_000981 [Crocinitomicaceae bacterium]